ncbi:hypothetical protein GN244_ATG14051 [Phytophthora infestans]|uniref:Uncharacterized protein n=1 Tax=Phytophthora infestans TaxID=4787 RepID=A0A833T583_PHYIN|nr:hypothetical protein GN244_ATG14051 [Phytophthora infestans]
MDDLEDAVALVIALAGHAVSLAACVRQDDEPRQRHTASILHFDAIRHGAEGNRETTADMGMNKSYVIEIADAVARVLYRVAGNVFQFPTIRRGVS